MFTALLLGQWLLITAYGWHARLRNRRLPVPVWLLLWLLTAAGIAATATGTSIGARAVHAAPVACLAALSVVLTRSTISRSSHHADEPEPQPIHPVRRAAGSAAAASPRA